MQRLKQILPAEIILPLKDRNELISADTINRTVPENFTDDPACLKDLFIARFVTKRVIDGLQSVQVADCNGKLICLPFFNGCARSAGQ